MTLISADHHSASHSVFFVFLLVVRSVRIEKQPQRERHAEEKRHVNRIEGTELVNYRGSSYTEAGAKNGSKDDRQV